MNKWLLFSFAARSGREANERKNHIGSDTTESLATFTSKLAGK